MKYSVIQFKNLKVALKELEPFIRNGEHLQSGKPFKQLGQMRSREALANWLLCVVLDAEAGADGIVCSPLEVARVRQLAGPSAILVTPGVRSVGAAAGDQKRIATPAEAIRDGADYLVIGRQVTRATDPKAEVERILAEIVAG